MTIADQRMCWIKACLMYSGHFGRSEKKNYQRLFDVSSSAMSRDQLAFAMMAEEEAGRPLFVRTRSGGFEGGKLTLLPNARLPQLAELGEIEPHRWLEDAMATQFEKVERPFRAKPKLPILRVVVQAIREERPIRVIYFSRSSGRSSRTLSPHTMVDVVGRLHVRAFDHSTNRFADFLMTRILDASIETGENDVRFVGPNKTDTSAGDVEWRQRQDIEVATKPSQHTEAVRLDWQLDEQGRRRINVRAAIAPYLVDERVPGFENPVSISKV